MHAGAHGDGMAERTVRGGPDETVQHIGRQPTLWTVHPVDVSGAFGLQICPPWCCGFGESLPGSRSCHGSGTGTYQEPVRHSGAPTGGPAHTSAALASSTGCRITADPAALHPQEGWYGLDV